MEGGTTIYVNEDTFYQSKKTDDTKISLTYYLGHKWIEVTIPLLSGEKKVEVEALFSRSYAIALLASLYIVGS